jgi:hypothetical protein
VQAVKEGVDEFVRGGRGDVTHLLTPHSSSEQQRCILEGIMESTKSPRCLTRGKTHHAGRESRSSRSDDLDSELSALSLKLEREKLELARKLRDAKDQRRWGCGPAPRVLCEDSVIG